MRSLAERAPALSNGLMSGCSCRRSLEGREGLSAAMLHAFASYLPISNSINFYAFIVFN